MRVPKNVMFKNFGNWFKSDLSRSKSLFGTLFISTQVFKCVLFFNFSIELLLVAGLDPLFFIYSLKSEKKLLCYKYICTFSGYIIFVIVLWIIFGLMVSFITMGGSFLLDYLYKIW